MGKYINFYGPFLKTERAEHHINKLEALFKRYIAENKKALRPPKYNRKPRARPIGANLSKHTPTVLGDAIHNLRAALDHAYCILVKANEGTIGNRTKFPFTTGTEKTARKQLEDSVKGEAEKGRAPSDEMTRVILDEIQPYPGGEGADLVDLHVLDIADKHMVLLPTQQRLDAVHLRVEGGSGICALSITTDGAPAIRFAEGARLDPKHNQKASFEICFGEGQPFEGQPILPILKGLAARVDETLRLLETRAKKTP